MAKEEVKKVVKEEKNKENLILSKTKETAKKSTKKSQKKTSKEKKSSSKTTSKKVEAKSTVKNSTKTSKKTETETKSAKKTTKSTSSKSKKTTSKNESTAKAMLAEYYDLPYRYNQTIVKILAQTPTTLFVYWDISDEDRESLINIHGENFFYETKPVLIVHNLTYDYSFEIEINDFANSWYIRTQQPNCDYIIELGRRFYTNSSEYIYIYSSNELISPNDHILFENSNLGNVLFKNVKTNTLSSKDFGDLKFINSIDKLYGNIYDVYSDIYNDEILNELANPSSNEFVKKEA